jgi:hypothetical protein
METDFPSYSTQTSKSLSGSVGVARLRRSIERGKERKKERERLVLSRARMCDCSVAKYSDLFTGIFSSLSLFPFVFLRSQRFLLRRNVWTGMVFLASATQVDPTRRETHARIQDQVGRAPGEVQGLRDGRLFLVERDYGAGASDRWRRTIHVAFEC